MNLFEQTLQSENTSLIRSETEILQLNVGKLCNLTCVHCHVGAGPKRKEIITRETIDKILDWFENTSIPTLDLTGGTPEMIPDFKYLVVRVRSFKQPRKIMDRLNATIINEPGYEWVSEFLAENKIEIISSMPCYEPENVEAQRGNGVFDSSIKAYQKLNKLGYGKEDPELQLHFVYNPNGSFLPPDEKELEQDYKEAMQENFGISFNKLYALANLPVTRFASYLKRKGEYESYIIMLKDAFNPQTVNHLMCRNTINVSWEGKVFDCDFNQMLDMEHKENSETQYLWDIELNKFKETQIKTANHCFGCTAGSGSSCGGTLV